MREKYLTKWFSVIFVPYQWVFGIMFFNGEVLFSIQILCFGFCFWKNKWKSRK